MWMILINNKFALFSLLHEISTLSTEAKTKTTKKIKTKKNKKTLLLDPWPLPSFFK